MAGASLTVEEEAAAEAAMAEVAMAAMQAAELARTARLELAVAFLVGAALVRHLAEASELARWARLTAALQRETALEEEATRGLPT